MADKEISNLPELEELTDDTLIPVYQPGSQNPAQSMSGAQFREFAEAAGLAGAEPVVSVAQDAANQATDEANRAVSGANRAEAAAKQVENMEIPNAIVSSGIGETVSMPDSAERPLRGLNIYGKTKQKQGTGAQMFDSSTVKGGTVNGTTLAVNDEGYLTYTGKATSSGQSTLSALSQYITLPAGTYTLSVDKPLPMRVRFNTTSFLVLRAGETSVTSTLTEEFVIKNIAIHYTSGDEYNETFRLMLNEGSEALPWEPYTGGIPVPTPDDPQELKNVGADGKLVVSVADGTGESVQTLNVSTPNGLPGVPVERGGNYTDENGQQWLCDEINFKRGVYIKRCAVDVLDLRYNEEKDEYSGRYYNYDKEDVLVEDADGYEHLCVLVKCKYTGVSGAFCNALPITTDVSALGAKDCLYIGESSGFVVSLPNYSDDFWLAALTLTAQGTPITVIRGMTSEYWTETPLTAEQLAEYAKLYSYYPSTIVTNDEDAGMAVEYVADTKNYIDEKFAELKAALLGG